jgi:predicted nucleotidyltransferase component of viral defense system
MSNYKSQVALLLDILPEVAKQKCFALHGGTAINLFIRDMPRLSVDIDLTYIPIEDRETSINAIIVGLKGIKFHIEKLNLGIQVTLKEKVLKLQIANSNALVKLEVNQINRGLMEDPVEMALTSKTQEDFNVFCNIQVVPLAQLYGGKICAALNRQHPRDLFDVKYLLDNEGFTEDIKKGFLLLLLCSSRPTHEILNPNLINQEDAMVNQFLGMSYEPFTYNDFEETRTVLIKTIQNSLTKIDKQFLLAFNRLDPDWGNYNFENFPAVQWKLRNLARLKEQNKAKFDKMNQLLSELLN